MTAILALAAAALGALIGFVVYVVGKNHGVSSADRSDSKFLALAMRTVGIRGVAIGAGLVAAFVWWAILTNFVGGGLS